MQGKFISFEGGEGSGKSTQIKLLADALSKAGISHVATREPGGTSSAEAIRELLVKGSKDAWPPIAETLLFYAARSEHVERLIKPALAAGRLVICDRFADSTLVYQGVGKGISAEYVRALHHLTLGNFMPDLTFILDIEPAVGLERAGKRKGSETRFEEMGLEFHHQVRRGFLSIATREPERCIALDATQEPQALHRQIVDILSRKLGIAVSA